MLCGKRKEGGGEVEGNEKPRDRLEGNGDGMMERKGTGRNGGAWWERWSSEIKVKGQKMGWMGLEIGDRQT